MIDHKKNQQFAKANLRDTPDEHWKFEYFVQDYIQTMAQEIVDEFNYVWNKQTEVSQDYGDIDWHGKKLLDTEKKKVLLLDNHSSCAKITKFLFFYENDGSREVLHIRKVWDSKSSDYRKGNDYVNKPSLKWYKDRQFSLEYQEELHWGPLGGSYADCRDSGYILTLDRYIPFGYDDLPEEKTKQISKVQERLAQWHVEKGTIYSWPEFQNSLRNLFGCRYDLERNEE